MKVAVLSEIEKITIEERTKPQIGPREALIKVEFCGICGSDIHGYLYGAIFPVGTVMGHEASGVVVEVGTGVENVKAGDRVVIKPAAPCRICHACKEGRDNNCYRDHVIGESPELDGAYAEYLRVPFPEEMLFKLPSHLSFEEGALVEPLATSLHSVRQSRFKPGDCVVVSGAGPIGLGALQLLKLGGAAKIIVLEISPERSEIAQKLGADAVLNPVTEGIDLPDKVANLTDGIGADILYECAGVPESLTNSIHLIRKGGQVMAVGVIEHDTPINPITLILKEAQIRGCIAYTSVEFQMTIDFMAAKKINTDLMISETIRLEDIEIKGVKRLISSTDAVKIMVKP
jgi:(R,R)-butanediol dehydrogenase/meso-butanediol dehydrogenase/diacetyl reductase